MIIFCINFSFKCIVVWYVVEFCFCISSILYLQSLWIPCSFCHWRSFWKKHVCLHVQACMCLSTNICLWRSYECLCVLFSATSSVMQNGERIDVLLLVEKGRWGSYLKKYLICFYSDVLALLLINSGVFSLRLASKKVNLQSF